MFANPFVTAYVNTVLPLRHRYSIVIYVYTVFLYLFSVSEIVQRLHKGCPARHTIPFLYVWNTLGNILRVRYADWQIIMASMYTKKKLVVILIIIVHLFFSTPFFFKVWNPRVPKWVQITFKKKRISYSSNTKRSFYLLLFFS